MPTIGRTEIIIIAVVILVLFGGSKIPSFIRGLGLGINEYQKSRKEEEQE